MTETLASRALQTKADLSAALAQVNELSPVYSEMLRDLACSNEELDRDYPDHQQLMEDLVMSLVHEKSFTFKPLDQLDPTSRQPLLERIAKFYAAQEVKSDVYSFFLTVSSTAVYKVTLYFTDTYSIEAERLTLS